jgi:adenylate kinase family enzyme
MKNRVILEIENRIRISASYSLAMVIAEFPETVCQQQLLHRYFHNSPRNNYFFPFALTDC